MVALTFCAGGGLSRIDDRVGEMCERLRMGEVKLIQSGSTPNDGRSQSLNTWNKNVHMGTHCYADAILLHHKHANTR